MKKEFGGYFEFEQLINNEYHKDLIRLNIARNALLYVLKAKKIHKLYIPFYLCDSIRNMLRKNGIDYEYYHITNNFLPIFNKKLNQKEFLYVVNYYGQLTNTKLQEIKDQYHYIIVDNTHSFFQKPIKGIDTIYSCRKFFGVPDGAYLSTDTVLDKTLQIDKSKNRMKHLLGRFEETAWEYYQYFKEADYSFETEDLKIMSRLTQNILGAIDYKNVCKVRNDNYKYLQEFFGKKNILKLIQPDGAYAYPLYVENGIEIRKKLAKRKIYIPTLWPNVLKDVEKESIEYQYTANILPLPCDQRYSNVDLDYLLDNIEEYL